MVIEIVLGDAASAGIFGEVLANEIGIWGESEKFQMVAVGLLGGGADLFAAFLFVVEAVLNAFESSEVAIQFGQRFAVFQSVDETVLDKGVKGFEGGTGMGLAFDADGIGILAEHFKAALVWMVMGVKPVESATAGGEIETAFGAWFGDDPSGDVVRIVFADFEEELLVLGVQLVEFVGFHLVLARSRIWTGGNRGK